MSSPELCRNMASVVGVLGSRGWVESSILCGSLSANASSPPPSQCSAPASFSSRCQRGRKASGSRQQPGRHWQSSAGERSGPGVHSRFSPGSCRLEGSQRRREQHLESSTRRGCCLGNHCLEQRNARGLYDGTSKGLGLFKALSVKEQEGMF